jgi:hypothetical protein
MKECVASMAGPLPKASLHAKRDAGKISGRVVKNLWALVSLRRKFSSPVSPTLQAIVHVKTGWIESRDPSIIRASKRTSSTFRVDFPAAYWCRITNPRKSDFTEPTMVPCSKYTLTSARLHPSRHGGRHPELYSYSAVKFTEV